ncbi:hypothetical protein RRG08_026451 [Elysia crispata]|uniref:Uncharacterized protein n=1 Tax=Elysia crispata TaxID=231223 RepID=A0AAE0Y3N5_9GAST|nr:hypothetical protein RRG08_026451 [Elysia crispata]
MSSLKTSRELSAQDSKQKNRESLNSQEAATVETRAASKRESKMFKTLKEADLGLSKKRLKVLQQKDPTLEQAKKIAEVGDEVNAGKASESWYSY